MRRHGGRCQRFVAAALVFCGSVAVGWADGAVWSDPKRVTEVRAGIFCAPPVDYKSDGNDTIRGDVWRYNDRPLLIHETNTIPAVDHILFGVEAREMPSTGDLVRVEVRHPPLGRQGVRHESWTTYMRVGDPTFSGYDIGLSDGDPVGTWSISATQGSRRLYMAVFEIVPAKAGDKNPCLAKLSS